MPYIPDIFKINLKLVKKNAEERIEDDVAEDKPEEDSNS